MSIVSSVKVNSKFTGLSMSKELLYWVSSMKDEKALSIFFIYTQNGYVHVNVNSPGLGQGLGLAGQPVVAVNVIFSLSTHKMAMYMSMLIHLA